MAINEGIIKKEDVIKHPKTTIENLKCYEPFLKRQAEEKLEKIKDQANQIKSVDILNFYHRVNKVFNAFLERKHYWKLKEIKNEQQSHSVIEKISDHSILHARM
jgi:hypothetical protein